MKQFEAFKFLISDLSKDFTIYHQLFSEAESIKVLNEFNSLIFGNYQKCLLDSIYTKISRALDPAETRFKGGSNSNLSFQYFIKKFSLINEEDVLKKLKAINKIFKDSNLKHYRNKVLAHNDVELVEGKNSFKVELDLKKVEKLITEFWSLYCSIDYGAGHREMPYTIIPHITLPREKDGYSFVSTLKRNM